jgi:hypothetical protein
MKPAPQIPDAKIRVRFLPETEGGRRTDVSGREYGCPLLVDGQGFDCRFMATTEAVYSLGHEYEIPIQFLSPEMALPLLGVGRKISLWEGRTIAEGTITWARKEEGALRTQ